MATLITKKQIAALSLNEVDAAKIQLGDNAMLTFDAVPDLTLTGKVVELDPVGTVSQGVVTYTAKIGFDSQDSRIKPGMSVNADIQTAVHQDALTVPSTAIKTQNGQTYVQAFVPALAVGTSTKASGTTSASAGVVSATAPKLIPVTTGISDTTNTEIVSGLTAGQQIVTKTITGTAAATASTAASASRSGSAGGLGGAGGIRL